jgi:hypothetical protein
LKGSEKKAMKPTAVVALSLIVTFILYVMFNLFNSAKELIIAMKTKKRGGGAIIGWLLSPMTLLGFAVILLTALDIWLFLLNLEF